MGKICTPKGYRPYKGKVRARTTATEEETEAWESRGALPSTTLPSIPKIPKLPPDSKSVPGPQTSPFPIQPITVKPSTYPTPPRKRVPVPRKPFNKAKDTAQKRLTEAATKALPRSKVKRFNPIPSTMAQNQVPTKPLPLNSGIPLFLPPTPAKARLSCCTLLPLPLSPMETDEHYAPNFDLLSPIADQVFPVTSPSSTTEVQYKLVHLNLNEQPKEDPIPTIPLLPVVPGLTDPRIQLLIPTPEPSPVLVTATPTPAVLTEPASQTADPATPAPTSTRNTTTNPTIEVRVAQVETALEAMRQGKAAYVKKKAQKRKAKRLRQQARKEALLLRTPSPCPPPDPEPEPYGYYTTSLLPEPSGFFDFLFK